jgi:hypothetical protein
MRRCCAELQRPEGRSSSALRLIAFLYLGAITTTWAFGSTEPSRAVHARHIFKFKGALDMSELRATAQDYRRALLAIRDSRDTTPTAWSLWVKLLRAQYLMPDRVITDVQLADAAALSSANIARLRYGALAHLVANHLGYVPPCQSHGDGKPMWWMALSTNQQANDKDRQFKFAMQSELAQAIELMGWVKPAVATGP